MNDQQYRNLMWHLLYVESMLENIADSNAVGGGLRVSRLSLKNPCVPSVRRKPQTECAMPAM